MSVSTNVSHKLNDADERILDELAGGRNLPQNLATELGYSRQYVQNRLQMLKAADYVENIGGGLYELVDDPRDDVNQPDEPEAAPLEYVVALETHIEAANEALDNDDPDVAKRHIRAAGDEIGEIRLLDEVEVNERD